MKMNKKGFTLIELLVVVLIIGILAAIALPQYFKAVEKARSSEALAVFGTIAGAEQRYYLVTGGWTDKFSDFDVEFDTIDSSKTLVTNSFTITLDKTNGEVKAARNGGRYGNYELYRDFDSSAVTCKDVSTSGICTTLGIATHS